MKKKYLAKTIGALFIVVPLSLMMYVFFMYDVVVKGTVLFLLVFLALNGISKLVDFSINNWENDKKL